MPDLKPKSPGTIPDDSRVTVDMKEAWGDEWIPQQHIFAESLVMTTASAGGISECRLSYRYGPNVQQPGLSGYAAYDPLGWGPLTILGTWVRVRIWAASEAGHQTPKPQTIWIGRVESWVDRLDAATGAAAFGVSTIVAQGPERWLERIDTGDAFGMYYGWADIGRVKRMLSFNLAPPDRSTGTAAQNILSSMAGNRTGAPITVGQLPTGEKGRGSYIFGNESNDQVWTHRQALEYVLQRHVSRFPDGPDWTIGGQADDTDNDVLKSLKTIIPASDGPNAKELINRIIPSEYGLDWNVVPDLDPSDPDAEVGFKVNVFSLLPQSIVWSGSPSVPGSNSVCPKNPRVFALANALTDERYAIIVERSGGAQYDRLRIVGNRVKLIASAGYDYAGYDAPLTFSDPVPTPPDYNTGGGLTGANDYETGVLRDAYRAQARFRDVGSIYKPVASSFGSNTGKWPDVSFTPAGTYAPSERNLPYISLFEPLFSVVPLLDGVDYSQHPPQGAAVPHGGYLSLEVFGALRKTLEGQKATWYRVSDAPDAIACVQNNDGGGVYGVSGSFLPSITFGPHEYFRAIRLCCNPQWALVPGSSIQGTAHIGGRALGAYAATFCTVIDARPYLEYTNPTQFGDGSIKIIEVPECEFHWLAPRTIVGIGTNYDFLRYPGPGVAVRNDSLVLHRRMAGAIARFVTMRTRMVVQSRRLDAWSQHVGAILSLDLTTTQGTKLEAPITSCEFDFAQRVVRLATGQAEPEAALPNWSRR